MGNNEIQSKFEKGLQRQIVIMLKKNGIVKAGLFGSYARGEATKRSDIDILIKFGAGKSLLDLTNLELKLEKKLGKRVDLLTYESINPLLRKRILNEEVKLL